MSQDAAKVFEQSVALMARLRGPGGCAWDREQTFDSIKRHTLEETYEVFDAIDRRAWPNLKEELGDLLLQVLFYAQMAEEAGHFSISDVAASLNAKLIRRHPHIFGDAVAATPDAVNRQWERIKQEEKSEAGTVTAGLLDQVPRYVPAMMEAGKLGRKAAGIGFDWPTSHGLVAKLHEEVEELRAEIVQQDTASAADELGDVLFTAVNLSRHLGFDPEFALRGANSKFRRRFAAMESASGPEGVTGRSLEELEELWQAAKDAERD